MKKIRKIWFQIQDSKQWLLVILLMEFIFIFLAWLAYPEEFWTLLGLMLLLSIAAAIVPLLFLILREQRIETSFQEFLTQPDQEHEERLCQYIPKTNRPYIRKIGLLLRENQDELNNQLIQLKDYQTYIEEWVHEIKKPLSVLTLVLDNREEEMSPLVKQRMLHVKNEIHDDVEKILYFARLDAVHKDYLFRPVDLWDVCREAVNEQRPLLEEFSFEIDFIGNTKEVISDQRNLLFILSQIISNSVKYTGKTKQKPSIQFQLEEKKESDQIVLKIQDNGPGVAPEDLPFIFDKGFTGAKTDYGRRATGMGLYLVKRVGNELAIDLAAESREEGLSISIVFPRVSSHSKKQNTTF